MRLMTLLPLAIVAGCTKPLPLESHPCPCVPGYTCDTRYHICVRDDDAPQIPDAADTPSDSPPDAEPVSCQGNADCQTTPDLCSKPGTCNLTSHTCDFPQVDCATLDDECSVGVCDVGSGSCDTRARNEGNACGAGTVCDSFGPCGGFSSVCDDSGTRTRKCTDHTCRSGTCMASSLDEMVTCMRNTNGTTCGPDQLICDTCIFADDCRETAPPVACTCSSFTCQSGTCEQQDSSCSQPCTRSTEGRFCGCQSCGAFAFPLQCTSGACSPAGPCGDC
jgi:hypothetical protein